MRRRPIIKIVLKEYESKNSKQGSSFSTLILEHWRRDCVVSGGDEFKSKS